MIPKIIHYVWLGNDKKPALIRKCIASWRKVMPDWDIKMWTMENIPHNIWIDEALSVKKWAFVSDYVRAFALFNYGGVYFDSDIFLKKRIDEFLSCSFFTGVEYNRKKFFSTGSNLLIDCNGNKKNPHSVVQGLSIQSAVIAAEKGCPYIKEIMSFYENRHFINDDGSYFFEMLAPDVQAFCAEKYGFKYKDEFQKLNGGGYIYPSKVFASGIKDADKDCYAIHVYSSSWKDYSGIKKLIYRLKIFAKIMLLH